MTDEIPPEIEDYLVGNVAAAGELGGRLSGQAGAAGGGRSGGEGQARRMPTKVARERTTVSGDLDQRLEQIPAQHQAEPVPAGDARARYVVSIGRTGLQKVVVDVAADGADVTVTAYAKEGLLSRKPAAKTAKAVAELLAA